ncbi:zinc-dependent alcohol dehydrogenase [Flexibacterium corallicola]|uniref:zinc-dependent alcohol dehydrogenase n=1 Tax=Flexibacterium corallicola TaxID=3037259 RepID=UPI00286F5B78|nr:zinc-binding alcohol dehydrogenase [Pseudovibrio sp. M1P-2-3]
MTKTVFPSRTTRSLWYTRNQTLEIFSEKLSEDSGNCIQLKTVASGISTGTEALVYNGMIPESEYERMRAPFQAGNFPFPVKYGYSLVAQPILTNPSASDHAYVFALHPHQEHVALTPDQFIPVPTQVPPLRATLAANMETALNAVWDAQPLPATNIAIVGAGTIGCLIAYLCASNVGANVTLIDIKPTREKYAKALGCSFADERTPLKDQDLVFHCSASAAGLEHALILAGQEALIVECSWFGALKPEVPLGQSFHSKRLKIFSSQVGSVALPMRSRRTRRQRLMNAMTLLKDPALDILLAPALYFDEVPQKISSVLSGKLDIVFQPISYTPYNREGTECTQ